MPMHEVKFVPGKGYKAPRNSNCATRRKRVFIDMPWLLDCQGKFSAVLHNWLLHLTKIEIRLRSRRQYFSNSYSDSCICRQYFSNS
jgi:hypothetical protein